MSDKFIVLECLHCARTIPYPRNIDESIPPRVVRITQPHCDHCWNGDFEGETWLDAEGRTVPQTGEL